MKTKTITFALLFSLFIIGQVQAEPIIINTQILKDGNVTNILAHPSGLSLYVFDLDSEGVSNCSGTCAEKWPPFIVSDAEKGLLSPPFSSFTRQNGLNQVSFNGLPVYTYFLDRVAKDIKGDGVGGVWHMIPLP